MIYTSTWLFCADNSGARFAMCIAIVGHCKSPNRSRPAAIGDVITLSIKMLKRTIPKKRVQKGEVCQGIIVRRKFKHRRYDGTAVRSDHNGVVIVDKKFNPKFTRVVGPVCWELRHNYGKIIALAGGIL